MNNKEYELLGLYQFEYNFIPELIGYMLGKFSACEFLYYMSDLNWMIGDIMPKLNLKCGFDTSTMDTFCSRENENDFIIVYTYPTPSNPPLAKYGAIVLNSECVNYYTLEKAEFFDSEKAEYGWMLGSMSAKLQHSNYGEVPECNSPERFIKLLNNRGLLGQSIKSKKGFFHKILKSLGLSKN